MSPRHGPQRRASRVSTGQVYPPEVGGDCSCQAASETTAKGAGEVGVADLSLGADDKNVRVELCTALAFIILKYVNKAHLLRTYYASGMALIYL